MVQRLEGKGKLGIKNRAQSRQDAGAPSDVLDRSKHVAVGAKRDRWIKTGPELAGADVPSTDPDLVRAANGARTGTPRVQGGPKGNKL